MLEMNLQSTLLDILRDLLMMNINPFRVQLLQKGWIIGMVLEDRGDMAMIAYGASRFALAYGDKSTAKELWPLIEWCFRVF